MTKTKSKPGAAETSPLVSLDEFVKLAGGNVTKASEGIDKALMALDLKPAGYTQVYRWFNRLAYCGELWTEKLARIGVVPPARNNEAKR